MKRSRTLCATALLLCVVLLFSGCIKSDMNMTVNKDRSMDFSVTYMLADDLSDMSTTDEEPQLDVSENSVYRDNLQKRGFTVESYSEGDYTGFKASRHYDSIDALSSESGIGVIISDFMEEDFNDSSLFSVRRELMKDTYTAHFVYDLKEESADTGEDYDLSAFLSAVEITYSVTLPCKANGHNATSVSEDGLTYTWKIPYGSLTAIDYSFTMTSKNVTYGLIGLAGLLLLIALLTVILLRMKKRRGAASADNSDLPAPQSEEEIARARAIAAGEIPPPAASEPTTEAPAASEPANEAPAASEPTTEAPAAKEAAANRCPLCGGALSIRVANNGPHAGAKYAVCEHYPTACKFAKPLQ